MWHGITVDAIFIVVSLGILELILFGIGQYVDLKRSREDSALLEDLVTTLTLKEIHSSEEPAEQAQTAEPGRHAGKD